VAPHPDAQLKLSREVPTVFTFHGCDEIRESFGSPLHSVFSRGRDVLNRAARTDEQSRAGLVRGAIKEI
jgi:hypothetical protein